MDAAASIRTEADLSNALEAGALGEGDHLDFKRELTAGDRGTKDTAIDLSGPCEVGGKSVVHIHPPRGRDRV